MKIISLVKDYNINDAGNEDKIVGILNNISTESNSEITIDLLHCIIDYPATSMLIDKLLFQLAEQPNNKILLIDVSYFLPEQSLLNDLLGDSKYFGIEAKKEIPIDELRKKIDDCLVPKNILLTVRILNRTGEVRAKYDYGNPEK